MSRSIVFLFSLILAVSFSAASEPAVELPFTIQNGFILVKAQVGNHAEPLTFLVDSGASTSLLSLHTANRLHLRLGAPEVAHGVGIDVKAYNVKALRVTAGDCELTKVDLAVDLRNTALLCPQPVDGLIGADFFAHKIIQIDYAGKHLRLLRDAPGDDGKTSLLPIRLHNGVYCVGVSCNGSQPRWTRLDTGCNDPLHWVVPRTVAPRHRKEVSLGFMTDERDVTLASVTLGPFALGTVETSLHGAPMFPDEAGLLGNGILSKFLVTVDAPHHRLFLKPTSARAN